MMGDGANGEALGPPLKRRRMPVLGGKRSSLEWVAYKSVSLTALRDCFLCVCCSALPSWDGESSDYCTLQLPSLSESDPLDTSFLHLMLLTDLPGWAVAMVAQSRRRHAPPRPAAGELWINERGGKFSHKEPLQGGRCSNSRAFLSKAKCFRVRTFINLPPGPTWRTGPAHRSLQQSVSQSHLKGLLQCAPSEEVDSLRDRAY